MIEPASRRGFLVRAFGAAGALVLAPFLPKPVVESDSEYLLEFYAHQLPWSGVVIDSYEKMAQEMDRIANGPTKTFFAASMSITDTKTGITRRVGSKWYEDGVCMGELFID